MISDTQRHARAKALILPILLFLTLVTLTACASQSTAKPPPSALNIPVYPGSSKPDVVDKSQAQDGSWLAITYTTTAAPSTVLGYYDDILLSDDWVSQDTPDKAANRRFVWSSEHYETIYYLDLDILSQDGQTNVTLEFIEEMRL